MNTKNNSPSHTLRVNTYDELRQLVLAHAREHYDLTAIVGAGGIGKSQLVQRTMNQVHGGLGWGLVKGKHSPLDLYSRLYRWRLNPVVLDDLDTLLANRDNTSILKCVCDTNSIKRVEWGSTAKALEKAGIPKSFDSVSNICLVANDWASLNRNVRAIYDRGLAIEFTPSALEVHQELARGRWFDDSEVFRFIASQLFRMVDPSFRFYILARAHRQAGLDWKNIVIRTMNAESDTKLALVADITADATFEKLASPEAARERAFAERGGGSRATFYRSKSKLLEQRGAFTPDEVDAVELLPVVRDVRWFALQEQREHLLSLRHSYADAELEDQGRTSTSDVSTDVDESKAMSEIEKLHKRLSEAIRDENYEAAAELRDQIVRLDEETR